MICPSCHTDNIAGTDVCVECHTDLSGLDIPSGRTAVERSVMCEPIAQLVPPDPLKIAASTSVREGIDQIVASGRNCALVVTQDDAIAGIFTERDVLLRVAGKGVEVLDQPVSRFMTPDPERLGAKDTIAFGLNRMMVGDYRHVPIEVDGKAVGVVSVRHILKYIAEHPAGVMSTGE